MTGRNATLLAGEIANNATADVTVDEYHRYKVTLHNTTESCDCETLLKYCFSKNPNAMWYNYPILVLVLSLNVHKP